MTTPHSAPDTAVLDIDGTLVDTNYHHALAWFRAFRRFDTTLPVWWLHRAIGMGGDQLVPAVAGDRFENEHGDGVRAAWKEEFDPMLREVVPFAGVRELLTTLAEEHGLAVVLASSDAPEHVEAYLDLFDGRDLARAWTAREDVDETKPEPDLIGVALQRAGARGRGLGVGLRGRPAGRAPGRRDPHRRLLRGRAAGVRGTRGVRLPDRSARRAAGAAPVLRRVGPRLTASGPVTRGRVWSRADRASGYTGPGRGRRASARTRTTTPASPGGTHHRGGLVTTASQRNATTNDAGAPIESDEHSLTVGPDGPILLQDAYLIEQMAQFNRERIPERQPHAKGSGAFGRFEVTNPEIAKYTRAALFQPGAKTEMVARFSTVAGERGSPDTWRDPRGFALKFYTSEGNYDMVGNNTPVFFVKDPMKFQHFIRSQKRLAANNLRDHDMQWDFWTLSPESAHQVAWLMGDRGIPRTWRHMNGYSSHTYMWINAEGVRSWVKYTFKTDQGQEYFTQHEADQMAAADTDYHTRDLWEHIRDGEYPTWTLHVQIMPYEDAANYRFNPFDLTKVWPHADYPLIEVGKMTLDRNPTDYHAEIEQAAFQPNNLVPGIGPSPDRMLLARLFSYADSHRHRVGTNYQQLPVNAPKVPVHSYSKDGAMRYVNVTDPVYAPNSKGGPAADTQNHGTPPSWHTDGEITRAAYVSHAEDDDWGQPGTLVREVMDEQARERLVDNVVGHLLNGVTEPVLQRAFEYWRNIDKNIGDRIASGVESKKSEKDPKAAEQGNPARESMQSKA